MVYKYNITFQFKGKGTTGIGESLVTTDKECPENVLAEYVRNKEGLDEVLITKIEEIKKDD